MTLTTTGWIHKILGPDVQADVWNGTIMPYDAVYERRISDANTYDWWIRAHKGDVPYLARYHDRFKGYCPRCQEGN